MTAREQFLLTPHAEPHRKLVQTDSFREALNYAMLQLLEGDFTEDQIRGAKEFRSILNNLATKDEVPRGTQPPTIRHDAYDRPTRTG